MAYVSSGPDISDEVCFLCAAAGEAEDGPSLVVDRGDLCFTLMNRYPYTSGHVMVVPYRHTPDLLSMTPAEGAALFAGVQRAIEQRWHAPRIASASKRWVCSSQARYIRRR